MVKNNTTSSKDDSDEIKKYELEVLLEELEGYKGRHTELITVLIPAGASIIQTKKQLENEKGTATNIKSTATRKNVINALELAIRRLKDIGRTPENGLAVFSGNVKKEDGRESLEIWAIEPPKKLNTKIYRCDQTFVLGPLQEMLETDEIYGLFIIEVNESSIGVLDGRHVRLLETLHSGVPGKHKTGGQCLSPDTLIMKKDGEIISISEVDDSSIIMSENFEKEAVEGMGVIAKLENKKELFEITTCYPKIKIKASVDHTFFVRTNEGIKEKLLSDIREGDYLIVPDKINIKGKIININSKQYYNSFLINEVGRKIIKRKRVDKNLLQKDLAKTMDLTKVSISRYERGSSHISRDNLIKLCGALNIDYEVFIEKHTDPYKCKNISLPIIVDKDFARTLGYFMGDGSIETDKLSFFEERSDVSSYYKKLFDNLLNINTSYRFRASKNYHQLRINSRPLVRLIREEFPEVIGSLVAGIPEKIMRSSNNILAAFISGLFDADGYVSSNRVALGINNKKLSKQLQFVLLRFGILSSVLEYDNRANPYSDNIRYTVCIDDIGSIKRFNKFMCFTAIDKKLKLKEVIKNRSIRSKVRQLVVNGEEVAKIIRSHGVGTSQFGCSGFFKNRRQISKDVFKKNILNKIKDESLKNKLEIFYRSNIIPVKISKIESIGILDTVDIETESHNFIANGLIVHNSAQRFERIRDSELKTFFKRNAEHLKRHFWDEKKLKGIFIGGNFPTNEDFLRQSQLVTQLKNKVMCVKNMGGTKLNGLHELVGLCQEDLEEAEITKQKLIIDSFMVMLKTEPNMVSYGEAEVEDRLKKGAVDKLILSKSLSKEKIKIFSELAGKSSTVVHMVSGDTPEGVQFDNLGMIGGMLRFEIYD